MSDTLIVNVPAMTAAAVKIQHVAGSIGDQPWCDPSGVDLGAVEVQDAADDFATIWNLVIEGLADSIDELRTFMATAVDAYEALDQKLSGQGAPRVAR